MLPNRLLFVTAVPAVAATLAAVTPAAATPDHPQGSYRGSHAHGNVQLKFEHDDGTGLQLVSLKLTGTVDCDGQTIALADQSGPVTGRARVRANGRFSHNQSGLKITGRFVARKRVEGTLVARSLSCTTTPFAFSATRKGAGA